MAVDTPARIIVVGAGPIGLEAALYARFLGYEVEILECGDVAAHVRRWGHVRMFTPFRANRSPLGLAALAAQDPDYQPPSDDAFLTGREWVDRYLQPLSRTDLLADSLRLRAQVLAVARRDYAKGERCDAEQRAESPLRVVWRGDDGRAAELAAEIVIDASGVDANPNWLGQGGGPALGEVEWRARIEYGLPDVLGREQERYAGKRVLVVGGGYLASVTILALAELSTRAPETRVTWVGSHVDDGSDESPADDPCQAVAGRRLVVESARTRAAAIPQGVVCGPDVAVDRLQYSDAANVWQVRLGGERPTEAEFERVVANVGFRPDHELYRELRVGQDWIEDCPATVRQLQWTLAHPESGAGAPRDSLIHAEPNFYVLGAKSRGRRFGFLHAEGLEQIRRLFAVIGDRAALDLYAGARKLLP